nr:uncharacterized protein LOC109737602 [Aegilops tauschii subsp. strangulata]
MDPSIQAFLDRWESLIAANTKAQQVTAAKIDDLLTRRPDLERRVTELGEAMTALQLAASTPTPPSEDALQAPPPPATLGIDPGAGAGAARAPHGSDDRGRFNISRGLSGAPFQTPPPLPANGQCDPPPSPNALSPFAHASQLLIGLGQAHPSISFPQFSGENPNLWKTLCEQYFTMFGIAPSFWVPMAALNFSGPASIWLQSIQKRLSDFDWNSFTAHLCTRFGRDRHQMLIRQFYAVRQTTSVADYIEIFELIINHLSSYSDTIHPFYFLTRFVEGLRKDIRAVVLVQRPPDLDTACALALLQEEVADGAFGTLPRPPEATPRPPEATPRPSMALPLPPPPPRLPSPSGATDHWGTDAVRADTSKVKALRDYRRARGLCFKCGERWGHDHTCPTTVQLHVVEEMLELFGANDNQDDCGTSTTPCDTAMAISRSALDGSVSPKAFQLLATMQGQEVLLLVDSGSSTSFIDQKLAQQLNGAAPLKQPCRVRVADGGELTCTASIPACQWSSQGHDFVTDMKILPLGTYDAILRMDWLEQHSPMTVDWKAKYIQFPTPMGRAHLFGHEANSNTCHVINNVQLQNLHRQGSLLHVIVLYQLEEGEKGTSTEPPELQHLLVEFEDVFGEPSGLPPRRACDHTIPLVPGAQPVNIRPYRHKPEHKTEIERQVAELLKSGVIQRSQSNFPSPAILVKKKDGTCRLCIDYRHLNAMTRISKFTVPVIEELLDELHGARWFSKLDLRAGYHQIRLAKGEEFKTTFQTHFGHYEFKVLSFGLAGGPATFIDAMTETLHPVLRHCVLLFFDDILVFSKTWAEHIDHLRQVLELLRRDHWKVKRSKCEFGQQQLSYLGHVISSDGVATEPSKIRAVQAWNTPKDAKEVRQFLGLAGYYRRFVCGFGVIARPLFNLLTKGVPFVWTDNTAQAFELLKQQLITAPVLALPDFNKTFTVETDACDKGIGAVLQQDDHPIAFMSKSLSPRSEKPDTLGGTKALNALATACIHEITGTEPSWLEDIVASYNCNPQAQRLLEHLAVKEDPKGRFSLQNGILRFQGRIWLGGSTELQQRIMAAFHDSSIGGHSGFPATFWRIRRLFAWPKMKTHVLQYVRCCPTCQQAKPDRAASPGLLQPLPIPQQPWEMITMDFVEGLPQSGKFNCLWVIVDKRTKFAHFLPLKHPYTAAKVALLYMNSVYRIHGFPGAIVADRDPIFTSHFWRELFKYAALGCRPSKRCLGTTHDTWESLLPLNAQSPRSILGWTSV